MLEGISAGSFCCWAMKNDKRQRRLSFSCAMPKMDEEGVRRRMLNGVRDERSYCRGERGERRSHFSRDVLWRGRGEGWGGGIHIFSMHPKYHSWLSNVVIVMRTLSSFATRVSSFRFWVNELLRLVAERLLNGIVFVWMMKSWWH